MPDCCYFWCWCCFVRWYRRGKGSVSLSFFSAAQFFSPCHENTETARALDSFIMINKSRSHGLVLPLCVAGKCTNSRRRAGLGNCLLFGMSRLLWHSNWIKIKWMPEPNECRISSVSLCQTRWVIEPGAGSGMSYIRWTKLVLWTKQVCIGKMENIKQTLKLRQNVIFFWNSPSFWKLKELLWTSAWTVSAVWTVSSGSTFSAV